MEGQNGGEVREPELTPKEQLEVLKARLQEAIRKEEYEDAARYRDQIRVLTGEGDQNA